MSRYDLHSHSTVSDGLLTPSQLVERAASLGVDCLALTDHDDTAGLGEAQAAARRMGIRLVPGVEISVTWRGHTIHVVGLDIDPDTPALAAGLACVRAGRRVRAERMAADLDRVGVHGSLEGALRHAANPAMVGRTHFARFLVERGHARDVRSVFRKYLVRGLPGYVAHDWAALADAVGWVRAAGGLPVLAHPGRYRLGAEAFADLYREFCDAGGAALEVVSASHSADQVPRFARDAERYGLLASAGSDFHGPGESWMDLGALPPLPAGCRPVWEALPALAA